MTPSGLFAILDDPSLLAEEIKRMQILVHLCKIEGRYLDDPSAYLQVLTDRRDGIERCHACGRVKSTVSQ